MQGLSWRVSSEEVRRLRLSFDLLNPWVATGKWRAQLPVHAVFSAQRIVLSVTRNRCISCDISMMTVDFYWKLW